MLHLLHLLNLLNLLRLLHWLRVATLVRVRVHEDVLQAVAVDRDELRGLPNATVKRKSNRYTFTPGGGVACTVDRGKKFDTVTNCFPPRVDSHVR